MNESTNVKSADSENLHEELTRLASHISSLRDTSTESVLRMLRSPLVGLDDSWLSTVARDLTDSEHRVVYRLWDAGVISEASAHCILGDAMYESESFQEYMLTDQRMATEDYNTSRFHRGGTV